jgi:secreted trypsin-like serine protease
MQPGDTKGDTKAGKCFLLAETRRAIVVTRRQQTMERVSTPSVIDENWNSYARDRSGTCHGDSGAPTFFDGEVIDIASDGNADCATGDVRARVDTPEVRAWIFDTIAARLGN